jgi:hypothetical protein
MTQVVFETSETVTPFVDTYKGHRVELLTPTADSITFEDIARSLSRQARFNGHTKGAHPYSVAQHSVWVALYIEHHYQTAPAVTLQALLHDAHEAYIGDIATPVKWIGTVGTELKPATAALQSAIHTALNCPMPTPHTARLIKHADEIALAVEAHHLLPSDGEGWGLPDISWDDINAWHVPVDHQSAFEMFWICYELLKNGHAIGEVLQACGH